MLGEQLPPRAPSTWPLSDSGTSTQPVNRLALFHSLSPWRSSTRFRARTGRRVIRPTASPSSVRTSTSQSSKSTGSARPSSSHGLPHPGTPPQRTAATAAHAAAPRRQPQRDRPDVDQESWAKTELDGAEEERIGQRRRGDHPHEGARAAARLHGRTCTAPLSRGVRAAPTRPCPAAPGHRRGHDLARAQLGGVVPSPRHAHPPGPRDGPWSASFPGPVVPGSPRGTTRPCRLRAVPTAVTCMAETNASGGPTIRSRRAASSSSPPPTSRTASRVATIDWLGLGLPRRAARRPRRRGARIDAARTEPRIATPSAPPTWPRVVDRGPAPAFSRGTTDMIDSVAGAMTEPMPRPCTERIATSSHSGDARSSSWKPTKDSAMSRKPVAHTALAPNRSASRSSAAPSAPCRGRPMSAAPLCSGV